MLDADSVELVLEARLADDERLLVGRQLEHALEVARRRERRFEQVVQLDLDAELIELGLEVLARLRSAMQAQIRIRAQRPRACWCSR